MQKAYGKVMAAMDTVRQKGYGMVLPEKEEIRGHEFHYFDSTENGTDCVAKKPIGSRRWECVWEGENHWWGFPHLYYPSNPSFVEHFYQQAGLYQQSKLKQKDNLK